MLSTTFPTVLILIYKFYYERRIIMISKSTVQIKIDIPNYIIQYYPKKSY